MLSNKILTSSGMIVQDKFLKEVPKAKVWQKQFIFGVKTMSLKPITSLNANARSVKANRNTAESTITRTLHNSGLPNVLAGIVAKTGLITPKSYINCDHSDFNGLNAFVLAVQTGKGRALPVYASTAYSGKLPALDDAPSRKKAMREKYNIQESLSRQTESNLEEFASHLGFWPRLVFDRGFGGVSLIRFLAGRKATFYIRLKAGRLVEIRGRRFKVKNLSSSDATVNISGIHLRVVRSDTPKTGEPWYILTSDMDSARKKIIKIYYHRFEIEENTSKT